jgi:hypothetical protein
LHVSLPPSIPAPTSRSTSQHHALHPKDGGSKVLKNDGILPKHYMASQARRSQLESSLPWQPQISQQGFSSVIHLST